MGRRKKFVTEEDKKKAASKRSLKYYYENREILVEKAKQKYWDERFAEELDTKELPINDN